MVERLADVMDEADVEYSIRLTRLVDGEATYTLTTSLRDGPLEFPSDEDASNYVQGLRRQAKVRAVLLALREPDDWMIDPVQEVFWPYLTDDVTMDHARKVAKQAIRASIQSILDRSERTEGEG